MRSHTNPNPNPNPNKTKVQKSHISLLAGVGDVLEIMATGGAGGMAAFKEKAIDIPNMLKAAIQEVGRSSSQIHHLNFRFFGFSFFFFELA